MDGAPILELNSGLETLKSDLIEDELAAKRVEIAVVSFGPVEVITDFVLAPHFMPPVLQASGDTPMGLAINQGLDLVETRKSIYRANGIDYYRPWIMLLTDGAPTDNWRSAADRVRQGEAAKAFSFFAIGVQGANVEILKQISVRQPLMLKGLKFREFFLWLSRSMKSVSRSTVGETVRLENPAVPEGWASV